MRKVLNLALLLLLLGVANIVHFTSDFVMICLVSSGIHSKNGKHISKWSTDFSCPNLIFLVIFRCICPFLIVLNCFIAFLVVFDREHLCVRSLYQLCCWSCLSTFFVISLYFVMILSGIHLQNGKHISIVFSCPNLS